MNVGEDVAIEADKVHLVDRDDKRRDAEQARNVRVPLGLRPDAVGGVDEQNSHVGGRRAGRHVPRVLLVPLLACRPG